MPKNKAQLIRIQGIDYRLNTWKRAKQKRLATLFDVKPRQISRDIKYMKEELGAPITFDNNGYYYTEPFALSKHLPLTPKDIRQLQLAVKTLNQYQHLEAFAGLESMIVKIEKSVKFNLSNNYKGFINFEHVPHYEGTELIEFFIKAIQATRIVTFDYTPFKTGEMLTHHFEPYALKEHTNRWYVIGHLPIQNTIIPFALDRIIQNDNLKITNNYYNIPAVFDINTHFQYTVGMTKLHDKAVETVRLAFQPLQAKYFLSKPFHHYKIVEETKEELIIEMQLIPNYELIRKLVGMGNGVKILQPKSLQKELLTYLKKAIHQYD